MSHIPRDPVGVDGSRRLACTFRRTAPDGTLSSRQCGRFAAVRSLDGSEWRCERHVPALVFGRWITIDPPRAHLDDPHPPLVDPYHNLRERGA